VKTWLDSIKEHADPKVVKYLVGNKIDLEDERVISKEEGQELASQSGIPYIEASAKLDQNVTELMQKVMQDVYKTMYIDGQQETDRHTMTVGRGTGKSAKESGGKKCC